METAATENDPSNWGGVLRLQALRAKILADMGIVKLSVLMNQLTLKALRDVCKKNDITLTEGIRRAISVAKFLYDEADAGKKIVVADKHGNIVSELILRQV